MSANERKQTPKPTATTSLRRLILLQMFLEGLKTNEERYGYPVCPCRLGTGKLDLDRDIICPCDYRDPDVVQYGACYCRLYVNKAVYESQNLPEVPERRPQEKIARAYGTADTDTKSIHPANARCTRKTPTNNRNQTDRSQKEALVLQTMRLCSLPRRPTVRLPDLQSEAGNVRGNRCNSRV